MTDEEICDEILKYCLQHNNYIYLADDMMEEYFKKKDIPRTKVQVLLAQMTPPIFKQEKEWVYMLTIPHGIKFAKNGGFAEERKTELRNSYIAQLNDSEYKSHDLICEDISFTGDVEAFIHEVKKYADIEYKNLNEFGRPKYVVKLKNKNQMVHNDYSHHQKVEITGSTVGDVTLAKESTVAKAEQPPIKTEKKEWYNKALWSGIILLILSSIVAYFLNKNQSDSKDNDIKQVPTVQEQKK